MEDIRTYRVDDDDDWTVPDDERSDAYEASATDREVPFHIPRD